MLSHWRDKRLGAVLVQPIAEKHSRTDAFMQYLAVPIVTAVLGFGVGFLLDTKKASSDEDRLYLEERMKLWLSTAGHFNKFLVNYERLNSMAALRQKQGRLTRDEEERFRRFERDRTAAREELFEDLDEAPLFFSEKVSTRIGAFKAFFEKYKLATLAELPPMEEWTRRKDDILLEMRTEVRGK